MIQNMANDDVWRNWAGNQEARPAEVVRPATPVEVSDLVGRAVSVGRRVKPIGAGHSFTAIGVTDGIQLDLQLLAGLVAVDRESGLVTVEAGMPLHRLNAVLDQAGLSLSNLGDIDRQTVAGAISTGTHGTGRHLGGIATQIRALELVVGDSSIVRCSPTEQPELFEAARVGLGALGVITKVTLQAEPRFVLTAQERPMSLRSVVDHLDELVEENEHFEFFWFPHTNKTLSKRNNRLPAGAPARPLGRVRRFVEDEVISNGAFGLTCRTGRLRPALIPRINGFAAGLMGDREYADVSHRVFTSPRRVRFVEMEYAVPRAAVGEALAGIDRVIAEHDLKVSFPVEVRFAAGDDIPLSTATGRDSAYLAVHMFKGQPYETYFHAVEDLMSPLQGRPHWGKMHNQTAATLRERYPRFEDFLAVREKADPDGVFANEYLDRVLGPVRGA